MTDKPKPSLTWRIIRGILLVIVLIPVLFIASCTHSQIRRESAGREWCEQVIAGVEREGEAFIANHPNKVNNSWLSSRSGKSKARTRAQFHRQSNGEYRCSYQTLSLFFPRSKEYSSETGTWVDIN